MSLGPAARRTPFVANRRGAGPEGAAACIRNSGQRAGQGRRRSLGYLRRLILSIHPTPRPPQRPLCRPPRPLGRTPPPVLLLALPVPTAMGRRPPRCRAVGS